MSGICSAHQHNDPECHMCGAWDADTEEKVSAASKRELATQIDLRIADLESAVFRATILVSFTQEELDAAMSKAEELHAAIGWE